MKSLLSGHAASGVAACAIFAVAQSLVMVLPASAQPAGVAGQWIKLPGEIGARLGFDVVYAPEEKAFFAVGGALGRPKPPYQEQRLQLSEGIWENYFPKGKDAWGPKVGALESSPPGVKSYAHWGFHLMDAEGVDGGMLVFGNTLYAGQTVWDNVSKRAIVYGFGRLAAYDPSARAWTELKPVNAGPAQPHRWVTVCYIPTTRSILFVGGNAPELPDGTPGIWLYSIEDNTWRKIASELAPRTAELRARLQKLRALEVATRNRLHVAESDEESRVPLPAGKPADFAWQAEHTRAELLRLATEPTPRANSAMVFDAQSGKVVLFGGDHMDYLLADTWLFDPRTETWEQRFPQVTPAPRGGHAGVYLAKSGRTVFAGGYDYETPSDHGKKFYAAHPLELWTYDVAANRWGLLGTWQGVLGGDQGQPAPTWSYNARVAVAADDEDNLLMTQSRQTWTINLAQVAVNAEGTAARGVVANAATVADPALITKPAASQKRDVENIVMGNLTMRTGPFMPIWYDPETTPDVAANEKLLAELPANTWVMMDAPRHIKTHRDWGTATYDTDRQQILWFGGGHASHWSGTDVAMYSTRANLWRTSALWRFVDGWWQSVETRGEPLPKTPSDDYGGIVYDSRRNQALLFAANRKTVSGVWSVNLSDGFVKKLNVPDLDKTNGFVREAVYLPSGDLVLLGATLRREGDKVTGMVFDPAAQKFGGLEMTSAKSFGGVGCGLMYDPKRDLVWAVYPYYTVYTMRFDPDTAKQVPLAP